MWKRILAAAWAMAAISTASWGQRQQIDLLDGWRFHKGAVAGGEAAALADSGQGWEAVSVPHTWNAQDGQDGGNDYYRGESWYRRHVMVDPAMAGKSLYLRFEAVNRKADVYVNGTLLGSHAGGESAFCLDATKLLRQGDNLVAVKASNRVDPDMPPLQADFTFFGGIYRPVQLIAVNPVHISLTDYSSPGIYATTPHAEKGETIVSVRVLLQNDSKEPLAGHVSGAVFDKEGKGFGGQGFNLWNDSVLKPGEAREESFEIGLPNPHLWNGRADPYLYTVNVTLSRDGPNNQLTPIDSVSQPLGIRTFSIDPQKGFLLNGQPYDLHGVDRHQDRQDKGWAISNTDHDQDMALIKEMGCTAIRLAHYQHAQYFYDLCDKEGMIVWAEIPVVDRLATGTNFDAFTKNAQQQYIELIRQNFNHPSICFWSTGNEVDPPDPARGRRGAATASAPALPDVYGWFHAMSLLEHTEDPSRLSASAWRERFYPPADVTDVFGLNEYLGWYTGGGPGNNSGWEGLENYISQHSQGSVKGKWAITEYGAGSSIFFHSEKPVRQDHTEEYQCLLHENTWKVLKGHPEIWGKFIWNMFDFAVDGRAEGDHAGRNDKGLVTYDRKVKKDAFYFYKAVWSDEPTVYLTGRRFEVRGLEKIPIKVYSNLARVQLFLNGAPLGEKSPENGTIVWDGVTLKEGKNTVAARATTADGKVVEDQCEWTYRPGAPLEVYQAQDERMRQALLAGPPRAR
jgi:beta-galactosidase